MSPSETTKLAPPESRKGEKEQRGKGERERLAQSPFPLCSSAPFPKYDFSAPTDRFTGLTLEEWRVLWRGIGNWKKAEQWFYGDLFNSGRQFVDATGRSMLEEDWAQETLKLIPHVGIDHKTLINWGYVALLYPAKTRRPALSWSHHRELIGLPPAECRRYLDRAEKEHWAVADLREAIAPERESNDADPGVAPARFVPRLFVQQSLRFLAAILPTDEERVAALRVEFAPVIEQFKRLGIV